MVGMYAPWMKGKVLEGETAVRWLFTILYGLLNIGAGRQRGIEAKAYEPDALWFCLAVRAAAIAAGFMYRTERRLPAAFAELQSES